MSTITEFTVRRFTKVTVDFNARDREGRIRVRDDRLHTGDHVLAVDPDDGTECLAVVAAVDPAHGLAYLLIDWGTATAASTVDPTPSAGPRHDVSFEGSRYLDESRPAGVYLP